MRALVMILLAGAMAASPGSATQNDPSTAVQAPNEVRSGLTCAWTMLRRAAAVGRQCRVGSNAAFQSSLEYELSRIEDHARQSAPAVFAQMQARGRDIDATDRAHLCTAGAIGFYQDMTNGEAEAIRDETDRVIALPRPIEWGTCL